MPTWWEELLHAVTGRASRHRDLPDLRDLPSRRVALERTHYIVNDREHRGQHDRLYVLRRERPSRRDRSAIAVYSNGRGVGYLPARTSSRWASALDLLGGAAIVNGIGPRQGSGRLWVDLPTDVALAEFTRHRPDVVPTA